MRVGTNHSYFKFNTSQVRGAEIGVIEALQSRSHMHIEYPVIILNTNTTRTCLLIASSDLKR